MLMGLFIKSMGFLFSLLPYSFLEFAVEALGFIFVSTPSNRRRLLFSNLKHAFPEWDHAKIKTVARKSSARMFEMGFFSLTYPFLSKEKRKRTVLYSKQVEGQLEEYRRCGSPVLILLPHLCLFETLATSPYFRPKGGKSLGAIYRPNRNPTLDRWINQARLKTGVRTFARKAGLLKARDHLRKGNWLVVLFDQNAGLMGNHNFFLDRLCSISPLPDLLGKIPETHCFYAFPKRTAFFQSQLELRTVPKSSRGFSADSHGMLEDDLRRSPDGLPEWLWSHGKWKTQNAPNQIFHLHSKRLDLPVEKDIPRCTRIWIRMPNWLGDVVMAIPLIRAIEKGRPDAEITLLCQSHYKPLLEYFKIGQRVIVLPPKGIGYFFFFWKLRKHYPDIHFLFTNSLRGDLEAYLCGAPLRLGGSTGRKRKFLSHQATISNDFEEKHQTLVWREYLKFFGLKVTINSTPFIMQNKKSKYDEHIVCLAPGSSNSPEKRWSTKNWIKLLKELNQNFPLFHFKLVGTSTDSKICSEIFNSVNSSKIENLAGKTDLFELCELLTRSKYLVCNDSGSMHLANLLGTQIVAIFNTTNPEVTGPFFNAKRFIINRNSCASEANFDELISSKVFDCLKEMNELTKNVIKAKD